MQWPSKCVRPSNLIMAISCYSDFSNSLLGAATGTCYWLKLLGWLCSAVGERDWSACFSESRCSHPHTPHTPTSPHASHKHTNMQHRPTKDKCVLTHTFADFHGESCCTRLDRWSADGSYEQKNKEKKNSEENVTRLWNEDMRPLQWPSDSPAPSSATPHTVTMAWCLCVWGVMRRRDKSKSDGGQAAVLLAALTDLTHHPVPPWQAVQDTVCLLKMINNLACVDMD